MGFGNELPKRKPTRLREFDYGSSGAYFITICTENRKNILSTIVGEGFPLPQLSIYGNIAEKWIKKISDKYNKVSVDCYVIMPNHIHLLLTTINNGGRGDPSPTVTAVVGWLKYQITREINQIKGTGGAKIFQRSFYDHVIRNRNDYEEIWKYIYENPIRWKIDKLYSEDEYD